MCNVASHGGSHSTQPERTGTRYEMRTRTRMKKACLKSLSLSHTHPKPTISKRKLYCTNRSVLQVGNFVLVGIIIIIILFTLECGTHTHTLVDVALLIILDCSLYFEWS